METLNPTRMNLLLKREELKDATRGAELLRNKRDVLLREFFLAFKAFCLEREALDAKGYEASASLFLAYGLEGKEKLASFSFIRANAPHFEINYKNLLGLRIPEVVIESGGSEGEQNSPRIDTGLAIEETQEKFQHFLKLALVVLPQYLKVKRLGQEIKNTTRKVNSF